MTIQEKRAKRNWFLFMLGYFSFGYMFLNWLASGKTVHYDLSLAFENQIPFIPAFILGYCCVYLGMFVAFFVIDTVQDWQRTVVCFLIMTTACYVTFYFFPVKMSMRPDLAGHDGIFYSITRFIFAIDLPYNCFPSLHVAFPTFATLVAWKNHKTARWTLLAMAVIVMVSVVLVKQHYIADVLAGVAVSLGSFAITVKTERLWKGFFSDKRPGCALALDL
jgi:membrane-associated phospholipid phosphatase